MVLRLYDTMGGSVLIDDLNIREFSVPWLRGQMGVVTQEPVLFAGSIYENIANGAPGASKEEVEKAAADANCHDFIMNLPQVSWDDEIKKKILLKIILSCCM